MRSLVSILGGALFAICLTFSLVRSADDVLTPIGRILTNPVSFHRKPVVLQGAVKGLESWRQDMLGREQCNQAFKLEDESGVIDVNWTSWCQAGEEKAVQVSPGDQVKVYATIEAPPENLKNSAGSDFGFKALATKITKTKP